LASSGNIRKAPIKVIVDSNALFAPSQFKIDVFGELERLLKRRFELILLSPVKYELELLAETGSPKTRRMAGYALKLSENFTYVKVDYGASTQEADDGIFRTAAAWKAPVFTNDVHLRQRLRDISVPVIYVRQKSHLEIDGKI
jgi:rRNA-processing protein FCF1